MENLIIFNEEINGELYDDNFFLINYKDPFSMHHFCSINLSN